MTLSSFSHPPHALLYSKEGSFFILIHSFALTLITSSLERQFMFISPSQFYKYLSLLGRSQTGLGGLGKVL